MRPSRKHTLAGAMGFHKMWRGHNREHVLRTKREKTQYLDALKKHKAKAKGCVLLFAYCVMGNHSHEAGGFPRHARECLERAISALGAWMRAAHSVFGAWYNKVKGREGKVAYDRPKTKPIYSNRELLNVMAYIDANPVRAKIAKHPSEFEFSSYNFYAYGKRTEYSDMLDIPEAYLKLGRTPKLRQKRYRQLIDDYLRKAGLLDDEPPDEELPFTLDDTSECIYCNGLSDTS